MIDIACIGCGFSYDDPAWIEAVVSDKVFEKITVSPYQGAGILCIQCIARRCVEAEQIRTAPRARRVTGHNP